MLLHQDGSTHQWAVGKMWDLIVTMDDATGEQYARTDGRDNCVSFEGVILQIPSDAHRCNYIKTKVRVQNGTLAIFHGPRKLAKLAT